MKKYIAPAALSVLTSTPALAHHPLGGVPIETFTQGLLSGVGHPLLGFDHLFFVIIVGVAALYTGYGRSAPAVYIGAMLVGCTAMSFGIGLPLKEVVIGLSLLVVGAFVLSGRSLNLYPALGLFAVFGLFHGSAFGDFIAAQEASVGASVLIGYLIGLGVLQYAIAFAAANAMKLLWNASESTAIEARLAGAVVAGIGMYLTLENVEGFALAAVGVGV